MKFDCDNPKFKISTLNNPINLHISPDCSGSVVDSASGLTVVSLPSPGAMLDRTQANLTQRLLDKLGDGVDIGVSGCVVYGQRRGEVKAYWSFSKFDHSNQPQEISKMEPQPLYMLKDFLQGGRQEINDTDFF